MTGKESYYTVYAGHEVMYHVSTMLPYSKDNPQQLERKRHIGNDIVNIIYTDDPSAVDTFNPNCIRSQFTRKLRKISRYKVTNNIHMSNWTSPTAVYIKSTRAKISCYALILNLLTSSVFPFYAYGFCSFKLQHIMSCIWPASIMHISDYNAYVVWKIAIKIIFSVFIIPC